MKQTLLLATLLFAIPLLGQRPDRAEIKEKLEAQKIAFITERLDLSPDEAKVFWPVYDEFQEKERILREQNRPPKRIEDMNEAEARAFITESLSNDAAIHQLRVEYTDRFLEILSPKKVIMLRKAEIDFRREVIEKIKRRFEGRRRQ